MITTHIQFRWLFSFDLFIFFSFKQTLLSTLKGRGGFKKPKTEKNRTEYRTETEKNRTEKKTEPKVQNRTEPKLVQFSSVSGVRKPDQTGPNRSMEKRRRFSLDLNGVVRSSAPAFLPFLQFNPSSLCLNSETLEPKTHSFPIPFLLNATCLSLAIVVSAQRSFSYPSHSPSPSHSQSESVTLACDPRLPLAVSRLKSRPTNSLICKLTMVGLIDGGGVGEEGGGDGIGVMALAAIELGEFVRLHSGMKSSASKASSSSSNSMRSSNSSREKMNSSSTSTPSQGIVGESTLPQLPMKWQGEAQRKVLCCLLGRLCVELELEDLKILFVQDMK
ncbi:hypothetical protein DVH24_012933 [Malus domestica]|uniref:Uncharacterized protein n=1 Tax=Malus domestica TaxID=3750 RepID=A0A498HQX6_MALDO|nr:hypothetical protein DVH24_012933 [Malus domestica]